MKSTTWQPLLTGESLERAREALAEIAESLGAGAWPAAQEDLPPEVVRVRDACLGPGVAGQALLCGYLHPWAGGQRFAAVGLELLDRAIETASVELMPPSLYTGFPGIAWTANHLAGRLYEPQGEDSYQETDDLLADYVRRVRWPFQFDLISGLIGIGVYALERLPRESARRCLETIVDRLAEVAERDAAGIAWLTSPELLGEHWRAQAPRGAYYLGMAHGVPGVVAFLASTRAADVARETTGPLLEGAVSWLLAQSLAADSPARFPNWRTVGRAEKSPARLAWCYGDPGVAAALLWAAAATGREDWRREGVATALRAARRPPRTSGVRDACLCHGSAGVAHIFNRLYQATGEEALGQAARFWYEQVLAARTPGQGLGGYLFERSDRENSFDTPSPGFLNGTAGVGLALLAAITTVEPAWDRVLLTSVPPRLL